jgi:hypothetical protein
MLTCIPQWGGDKAEHLGWVADLAKDFAEEGIGFTQKQLSVIVSILEAANDDYL